MPKYVPLLPKMFEQVRQLEQLPHPIVALGRHYPKGHLVERHQHGRAQLIYAVNGIMRVDTGGGIWMVPPMRALWMPPHTEHELRASIPVDLRTLFLKGDLRPSLPKECAVIEVTPLLRELILRAVAMTEMQQLEQLPSAFIELMLDEIREAHSVPLHVPLPTDSRALKICQVILANPADNRTASRWGAQVGASARTLDRLFQKETRMSFGDWRRQVRLLAALGLLMEKTPIATVARQLGYASVSAFTAMFRRALGRSPREFLPPPGNKNIPLQLKGRSFRVN